jgi:hypothetical protein
MAVHAGDETKPLECETCGKRFLTNSALAGHVKIHIHPDMLYDCPICLQEFEQVSSLKEHVYVHKVGGHFTCPNCQKTFTEYPNIRKHIRSFHAEKRFECNICSKSFSGKDKLKIHMVRHSEAKDFMCDDCGKQFKRKDKMREHVKRMHNLPGSGRDKEAVQDNAAEKFAPKVSLKINTLLCNISPRCHQQSCTGLSTSAPLACSASSGAACWSITWRSGIQISRQQRFQSSTCQFSRPPRTSSVNTVKRWGSTRGLGAAP